MKHVPILKHWVLYCRRIFDESQEFQEAVLNGFLFTDLNWPYKAGVSVFVLETHKQLLQDSFKLF